MSSFWEKLSVRERQLAIATVAVLVVSFAFFSCYRAVTRFLDLNNAKIPSAAISAKYPLRE